MAFDLMLSIQEMCFAKNCVFVFLQRGERNDGKEIISKDKISLFLKKKKKLELIFDR